MSFRASAAGLARRCGQAYAGVSYAVTSHIDLNLGYRYVRQFDSGAEDSQLHIIETGLIFRF